MFMIKNNSSRCISGSVLPRSQRFWQYSIRHSSISSNSLAVNLKPVVGLRVPPHCDLASVTDWCDGSPGRGSNYFLPLSLCPVFIVVHKDFIPHVPPTGFDLTDAGVLSVCCLMFSQFVRDTAGEKRTRCKALKVRFPRINDN